MSTRSRKEHTQKGKLKTYIHTPHTQAHTRTDKIKPFAIPLSESEEFL